MEISTPLNQKALAYLSARNPKAPLTLLPEESERDPYMHLGSHPDVVERLWKAINARLEVDCRLIVCGTPALVHPGTGVLLAFALGTQYCLHLPSALIQAALAVGAKTTTKWSGGRVTDIVKECGDGWVFGSWKKDEFEWCRKAYGEFGSSQ